MILSPKVWVGLLEPQIGLGKPVFLAHQLLSKYGHAADHNTFCRPRVFTHQKTPP